MDPVIVTIVTIVFLALSLAIGYIMRDNTTTFKLKDIKKPQLPPAQPVKLPPAKPVKKPLAFEEVGILIKPKKGKLKIGNFVQIKHTNGVRPYVVVTVNDQAQVGRLLPVTLKLLNPNRDIVYQCEITHQLKMGKNIIFPDSQHVVSNKIVRGKWFASTVIANQIIKEQEFTIDHHMLQEVSKDVLRGDLELTPDFQSKIDDLEGEVTLHDILN